ncbi:MAG: aminoacyl-tRNA hydrolase [Phycisphaerae bacterium]|nr:aminoacyl-tRNA hydrolase [Phycisphaerae bacterium]
MLSINDNLTIPDSYLSFRYIRSSGPGGQNVNKVNTCVQLTFHLNECPLISYPARMRLIALAGSRYSTRGTIQIVSDQFRHQIRNRTDCLNRLQSLIQESLIIPKKRRPTRPTSASKKRRLNQKRQQSQKKDLRRQPKPED